MSARRHWLSILALVALLFAPYAATPQVAAQLEGAVFFVDNLLDAGPPDPPGTYCNDDELNGNCSLRQAIFAANASTAPGEKQILFNLVISTLDPGDVGEIVLTSELPAITANRVSIVSPAVPAPRIAINGNGGEVGLTLEGDEALVAGLSFYGFTNGAAGPGFGSAILILGSDNRVEGNYLGVNPNGVVPAIGSNVTGVRIDGAAATDNFVGSSSPTSVPNVIAGNTTNGVLINNASGNSVINNQIGVIGSGPSAQRVVNGGYGVQINSFNGTSQNNTIGGGLLNTANVIGASGQAGILIRGTGTTSNFIRTNFIGIDRPASNTPSTIVGNVGSGIIIDRGASDNVIGGASSALVISNNGGSGIVIGAGSGGPVTSNSIVGPVYIGTNQGGTAPLGNTLDGILIDSGAVDTTIQGNVTNLRIGGNNRYGVHIRGTASGTLVSNALVGVTVPVGNNPPSQVRNGQGGVFVENTTGTTIRDSTISDNGSFGLRLNNVQNTTVRSNFIGLDVNRTAAAGNAGPGIEIINGRNVLVGGADGRNYIAGNTGANGHGIDISGTTTLGVTVAGNTIGLARDAARGNSAAAYVVPAGNAGAGVRAVGGGDLRIHENTIAESGGAAISVSDVPATTLPPGSTEPLTVSLRLNAIGFLPTNDDDVFTDVGNAQGIVLSNARAFEVISNSVRYSAGPNLRLSTTVTTTVDHLVAGNRFNNGGAEGVLVEGIARDVTLRDNEIRANTGVAVRLAPTTRRITLDANRMAGNGDAVVLEGTAAYPGTGADPQQANPGANRDIDPPQLLSAAQDGRITGQVFVPTNTPQPTNETLLTPISACARPCTIQAFAADPALLDGQGWRLLGFVIDEFGTVVQNLSVDAEGNFSGRLAEGLPAQLLIAATDSFGNTSAFAAFSPNYGLTLTPITPSPAVASAAPTETVTYRLLLENTGNVNYTDLTYVLSDTLTAVGGEQSTAWTAAFDPVPLPLLDAGASRTLTVTVTLPAGTTLAGQPNPNAAPGVVDRTRVTVRSSSIPTATVNRVLETTVLARAVLRVDPRQNPLGFGAPNTRVTYQHRITNDGNVPVTVNIDWRTVDPADSGSVWATTVSTNNFELAPGQSQNLAVNVTVPQNAQVNDGQGNPVRATTLLTATVAGVPEATTTFSNTTGVLLNPLARFFSDEAQTARAGATVTFIHELENLSNGLATFRFNVTTNFDSQVTLSSNTPGVQIVNNTVTLDAPNRTGPSRMQLRVTVRVDERRLPGDIEVVNIFLSDPATGGAIGANVVDTITITEGFILPRLYLPMVAGPPAEATPEEPAPEEPAPEQARAGGRPI
jgi:parallel beta-helix repeat protein